MRRAVSACLAALAIVALILPNPSFATQGKLRWETNTAMPTPRHEPAVTKCGGRAYVMGGFLEGVNTVPLVDVYDAATDSWSEGPPLPIAPAPNHAMAACRDGVVYHLGGYLVVLDDPTDRAFALQGGAWQELTPMPEPRAAGAAEFLHGQLYVVGGVSAAGVVDDMFVYNPSTHRWRAAPGPAIAREHLTLVRYRGSLYAIGGRQLTYETTMSSVERFDPATKKWTSMPPLPYATAGHVSAVTRNGLMVVAGGEVAAGPLSEVSAYDFKRHRWVELPALDPARTGFGAAAFGDRFFVFGGAGVDAAYYDITESLDLSAVRR